MDQGTDDQDRKTDWAEERTDWAEDRTVLANERTFAGWMRTGLASIALAVGLQAVFREADPTWLPKTVATAFLIAALVVFLSARRQACRALARLQTHDAIAQSGRMFTILAVLFSGAAIAVGVVLWTI